MAKNQNEKIALKGKMTDTLEELVVGKYGEDSTVKTVKGFVLSVDGSIVEVSCVIKKDGFDVAEANSEYLDKIQAAQDRIAEREAKAKKREALKIAKSSD